MSSAQNQIGRQGIVTAEKSISNGFIIFQTSHLTCSLHKFESCIQSIAQNGVYASSRWPAHTFWQAVEEVIETGWKENSHCCFSRGTWKASKNPPLHRTGRRVWYLHPWLRGACKRLKQKETESPNVDRSIHSSKWSARYMAITSNAAASCKRHMALYTTTSKMSIPSWMRYLPSLTRWPSTASHWMQIFQSMATMRIWVSLRWSSHGFWEGILT